MRKILPLRIILAAVWVHPLFATFELGVTPSLWLEYVQPSTFTYQMNTPGTFYYRGPAAVQVGAFTNVAGGAPQDVAYFQAGFFTQGRIDLRFSWAGDDDPRNQVVIDLKMLERFNAGHRSLFPGGNYTNQPLHGNLWFDIYYQGFFAGMNGYIKFGKYLFDIPSNWGGEINALSLEFGYNNTQCVHFFFGVTLYDWSYKETEWYTNQAGTTNSTSWAGDPLDPNAPYRSPYGNDNFGDPVASKWHFDPFDAGGIVNAHLVSQFGLNVPITTLGQFILRVPFSFKIKEAGDVTNNFRLMPIMQLYLDNGLFFNNTHFGMMLRKAYDNTTFTNQLGYVFMGREELGFRYSIFESSVMLSFQTAGAGHNTAAFTALNNRNPLTIHHGTYAPYLYDEVIPYTGHYSLSFGQNIQWKNFLFKLGLGSFWAINMKNLPYRFYDSEGSHIGLNYFVGVDWLGLIGAGSLFKVEATIFQPTQLSTLKGGTGAGALSDMVQSQKLHMTFRLVLEHTFR